MQPIPLPQINTIKEEPSHGVYDISPLYPGYGATVANSLRRVLLSSLEGAAVDSFKIEGVDHEFTTIDKVKEDVIEVTLNLKSLKAKLLGDTEQATLHLEKSNPGEIKASDFDANSEVQILNPDLKIATLDKGGKFELTVNIIKGRGFTASENKEKTKEIGVIAVDSFFSPVKHVSYEIENTRVGQNTDFDKVIIKIDSDGSIEPRQAIVEAAKILTQHYALISNLDLAETLAGAKKDLEEKINEAKEAQINNFHEEGQAEEYMPPIDAKTKVEDTDLSGRTKNALLASGFKTLSGLIRLSEIKLAGIKGLGAKGLEEVKTLLQRVEE
ncbi:MAG: DNA-directed RNA polymerase subunit alpha [Berkelbacteria bacterium GW2011_GWA2_38_9]|uniref:DNA-directed RNA polymerase subunit alpha n=1 Tax=Berkelbacteria bacterium GW2011_GWA2_38_9 TaxID=1618334 RepID=A0A0G0NWZ6_9BACT|nr:MAG: DNA-directed RNA polymerase subunit alpha [Berkelbacteria bacterium GW2011_GWA2_38_9]